MINDSTPLVRIYPEGNSDNPSWVVFDSVEEKEVYIKREWKFCYKLISEHGAALNMKKRQEVKQRLMKKQVDFCKSMGYSNTKANKKYWTKVQSTGDIVA